MSARAIHSLVIGASGGIGSALAARLAINGPRVALSRSVDGLDLREENTVAEVASRLAGQEFDLILTATGALNGPAARPERSFREVTADAMSSLYAVNAIGPALIVKHFATLLPPGRRSVMAFLSARVGSIGDNRLGGWMSYRASKAALNQIVRCAAIEIARARPEAIVLALHPGTIETAMTHSHARGRFTATPERCADDIVRLCAAATPDMSGGFFAYDASRVPW